MSEAYRHELKYYISNAEYELLSRKLALTINRDAHAQDSGRYFIRSLYFDDYLDSALNEKTDGNDYRDKYRIRIYNFQDDVIRLERKHKQGAFIYKRSLSLSRGECEALIAGQPSFLLRRKEPFAKEMYAIFRTRLLRPRVLVDYWREPYVFAAQDVRITFDMQLRTGFRAVSLFDSSLPTYPVMEGYGMILEVKFNQYLPGYIHALLQPFKNAQHGAISKYCLCRKYE